MPKFMDLSGQRYGRLVVICLDGENSAHGKNRWICRCDCGNSKSVSVGSLRSGRVKSCGCLQRERTSRASRKHGTGYEARLYRIWHGIKKRCLNSNACNYNDYGGRGISVCDEWKESYIAFRKWALSNGYNDSLTIDRINNDGDYCPDNCRWADRKTQSRNSRHAHNITIDGNTKCVRDWINDLGISESIGRSWLSNAEKYFVHNYKLVKALQNYHE